MSSFTGTGVFKDLYTEQDSEDYEKGTSNISKFSNFVLLSTLLNAPPSPLPLHYFLANKKAVSRTVFANPEPLLPNREDTIKKAVIKNEFAGPINKPANRNRLECRSPFVSEPYKLETRIVSRFNKHLCSKWRFPLSTENISQFGLHRLQITG